MDLQYRSGSLSGIAAEKACWRARRSGSSGWPISLRCRRDCARRSPGLTEAQLDTPYRPGGWTVRQVVHHLADSHMNSYVRSAWCSPRTSPPLSPTTSSFGRT